jgi:hypothetical protein
VRLRSPYAWGLAMVGHRLSAWTPFPSLEKRRENLQRIQQIARASAVRRPV